MKLQLEEISSDADSSFRILVNPNLSDFFYWHFHPELELVYIEGTDGTRHVGDHVSRYKNSDLVFIGSNIPHLNFDYGVKGQYEKIVVHLRPDFLLNAFASTPELSAIELLFNQSKYAISFDPETKQRIGVKMKQLHQKDAFAQFMEMLNIFQILAYAPNKRLLHTQPVQNPSGRRDRLRLERIYKFIENNYQRKIDLDEVASLSSLTREAFCRYFKKMTRLTFTEFVNHYRIDLAKKILLQDAQITKTCFDCGFESISYFNRVFKKITGTNPMAFKKEHLS
jgi:AraC-like DNA-binding protein